MPTVAKITVSEDKLVKSNELYDLYTDESKEVVQSITLLKAGQMTRGHRHSHCELYHFERGGLELYINGLMKRISGPMIIEIPPKAHHRVRNLTDETIGFRCTWLKSEVKNESVYQYFN